MTKRLRSGCLTLCFCLTLLLALIPLLFILGGSFMEDGEANRLYGGVFSGFADGGTAALRFVPRLFSLAQYGQLFTNRLDLLFGFRNSLLLLLPVLLGSLIVSPLAGFALAKFRFPGAKAALAVYILLAVLPYQTMIVPNYIMLDALKLLGTRWGIILTAMFHPLGAFICCRWMRGIPEEILESAGIDGAGMGRTFLSIILPLSRPALATLAVLLSADLWSMIEQPQLFLASPAKHPLSLLMAGLEKESMGAAFACGVLFSVPMVLFFLWCRDDFLVGTESMISPKRGANTP